MLKQRQRLVEEAKQLGAKELIDAIDTYYAYYGGVPSDLNVIFNTFLRDHGRYTPRLILLPLHPDWVSLIFDHKKTRELRLSFPEVPGPFTALVYETKQDGGRGLIVGEFMCDDYDVYPFDDDIQLPTPAFDGDDSYVSCGPGYYINGVSLQELCLTYDQVRAYGKGKPLYGWKINNPVEYNKPEKLSDYYRPDVPFEPITRAPQMYFEVKKL